MNIFKRSTAVSSFLLLFFLAVVNTALGGDYADGRLGQGVILDGKSQSIKIPHYAGLKPDKAITISAWIKPTKITKGWWWQEIYRKEDGNARALLAIGENGNRQEDKHCLFFGLGIGGKYIDHGVPLAGPKLLDGKWHLVCGTYDGKALGFYVDGKEIGTTKATGDIMTSGEASAYIGSAKGSEEYFNGGIDDVRIYNRALSADEIKKMPLADGKATVDGIVGWWKLDGNVDNSAAGSPKEPVAQLLGAHKKEMTVSKTYLLMPINNAAARNQKISLTVDGSEVRYGYIGLAEKKEDADWWAFFDISAYKGKTLTVSIQPMKTEAFALITQSDTVPGEDSWGNEPKRPQFHFSQKVGWNNDSNGMVYYKGEWHLYFQLNPLSLPWGNMTWGHAVSKDLVNWKQLPNVLHMRRTEGGTDDAMFSGGAAVDWKNTGGWKTGDNDVIIATWTSTGRGECIAYSNDKGRTFTEYEGNPVFRHNGRDPKPLWYAYGDNDKPLDETAKKLGGHWVIVIYDITEKDGRNVAFYTSTDLKKWTVQSHLSGYHECAELFTLPVDGDKNKIRWIVFGADAEYAIGDFDGKTFTPEHKGKHRLHHGSYYASQLFSDAPDDRRIQIGWAKIGMGDSPFNQTFSFPTELSLRTTKDGVRMFGEPVKEIDKIYGKRLEVAKKSLVPDKPVALKTSGALLDIRAEFELGTAKTVGLEVAGSKVAVFEVASGELNGKMPLRPIDGKIAIRILIDRSIIEIFANHGEQIMTEAFENDLNIESVKAFCDGGDAKLLSLEVHQLNAKWDN
jgi:fructan beta-fructosidase